MRNNRGDSLADVARRAVRDGEAKTTQRNEELGMRNEKLFSIVRVFECSITRMFDNLFDVAESAEFVVAVAPVGLNLDEQFEKHLLAEKQFDVFSRL